MRYINVGLIAILIWCLSLPDVCADQFEIRPYLSVRGEYDDNIFFDPDDEEDDYILTIKPGIVLTQRTERLDARLSGQIAPFFYRDNSDLDDVDQDYRGRINYQFTPRFFGTADAFFIKDHRPDRDILATGVVQNIDRRNRYHAGGGLGYTFSELTSASLFYDFNRDDWAQETDRRDVDTNAVTLGLTHNLSRWLRETSGRFTLDYRNIDRDTSEIDSFAATVGVRYRISELFRLRLRGGGRYVSSDFDVRQTDPITGERTTSSESDTGWGFIGSMIADYRGERARGDLLFSRDLSPGSGRGSATVLTRLVGSARYFILETLRVGLRAGIYRNKADEGDFGQREIDENTFRIRPDIRWEFYDNFTLTGAYRYTYAENDATNRNTSRNVVFLQLAYGLPLFDAFELSGSELRQVVTESVPLPEPMFDGR